MNNLSTFDLSIERGNRLIDSCNQKSTFGTTQADRFVPLVGRYIELNETAHLSGVNAIRKMIHANVKSIVNQVDLS